ncbi:type II secretion system F family protein [Sulfuritalea hydrogenivorans]|uniref:Type II secretory pathway, component PulF n=1 Tax=Sulfuritalea hydrogenivorans sk43H TaxID=1223802 RepID=W0SBX5_9PROT|nr:type II secretion system F family protein [Sulfuritalea hydrogenivorans]MDK9715873.1 type II secretion system F family protein [Sulfuritalea sp.]BAO28531.1 type II secretory pathway, component PulF [Sulfuritalea hydrogenivorans sk43H]
MASFAYRGRNGDGDIVQGVMEGATAGAVADLIVGSGVTPIEIKPAATAARAEAGAATGFQLLRQKVEHIDVLLFSRQIHTLLRAGVPIMRALAGLQESSANPAMKDVLQDVRESLDSGRELSLSLARHPKVFSPFYLSMVRVGEMTGRLEEVFIRLFDHLAFERFMKDQVKSALRYPSFVVAAMAIAIVIVNIFVIPAFAKVFKGFGAELPLMTRILIGFSDFMLNWWHVLLLGAIVGIFGFKAWLKTTNGRYTWDRLKLRIPIAGKIIRKATLARFAASFALASRSGVPIIQALTNVAETVDNAYIADKVERMRDGVERGESILRTSITAGVFTPVVLQMIAVGEESGALDDMMKEVADMYQSEVEYELKTLAQQIEPILILALGIMVLILALGIFLPLWDLGKVTMKR